MRQEQWNQFKAAAKRQPGAGIPLAMIVDSPWMPGHLGISHADYYFDPKVWFDAKRRVIEEFPDVTFFPSWGAEIGMAAEPSTLGVHIRFMPGQTPGEEHAPLRLEDLDELIPPDPATDGFWEGTPDADRGIERTGIAGDAHRVLCSYLNWRIFWAINPATCARHP